MRPLPPDPGQWLSQAQDAGDAMTWADFLTAATQVVVLLTAIVAAYWGLRRWVQRAAAESRVTARQLATSNGHTAGQLVESTAAEVTQLRQIADANRVRLDALDARLDRHLTAGHGGRDG